MKTKLMRTHNSIIIIFILGVIATSVRAQIIPPLIDELFSYNTQQKLAEGLNCSGLLTYYQIERYNTFFNNNYSGKLRINLEIKRKKV